LGKAKILGGAEIRQDRAGHLAGAAQKASIAYLSAALNRAACDEYSRNPPIDSQIVPSSICSQQEHLVHM
jgi:hypothetical protein